MLSGRLSTFDQSPVEKLTCPFVVVHFFGQSAEPLHLVSVVAVLAQVNDALGLREGSRSPMRATLQTIAIGLERMGVEFIPESGGGVGVRLRKTG